MSSGKVVVFGQKWLYSGKVVVFEQSGYIRLKWVVFGQIGFIRSKVVVLVWLFAINRTTIPRIYNCSELVCAIVDLGIVGLSVMCAYYWHNLFIYLCKT